MVTAFHHELSRATVIHPDAPPVKVPVLALAAVCFGKLTGQPHVTMSINTALPVVEVFTFALDGLIG